MRVEVNNLSKNFGSRQAVKNISFEIQPGIVTGFLGPNGSGKSTTLRLMLGLDRGEGSTLFGGKPLTEYPSATRVVGAHLDAKLFHPRRSARNHLRMLAAESGVSNQRVDEVLAMMGLSEVAKKRPRGFSLGMGQRLGLAGAVLAQPSVLLLDEPANGLDPATIHWLRDYLRHYAEQGNAVLVSSHLLSEMELMADDVIVIARGELLAHESVRDFVARSTTAQVVVRTSDNARFVELLHSRGIEALQNDRTIVVSNTSTDDIGQAAFDAGICVLELGNVPGSLEKAFLELTADDEEFRTGASA